MKSDDGFTMRQLNEGDLEQFNALLRYAFQVTTTEMVKTMNKDAIVFACANPTPEIFPEDAKAGGAKVISTGRSDYPNQINNVVAFPGIFKGALESRATRITEQMKLAAAEALAALVSDDELSEDFIMPEPFDPRAVEAVAALGLAESGGLIRLGMAPYCTESDIDRVLNTVAELARNR